jgi:kynurenine formamidase
MASDLVDLSHPIEESMPFFPGTEPPKIVDSFTIPGNGFAEKGLRLLSHTGTHVDAPCHLLAGAATLDELGPGHFYGPGRVLDVSHVLGRPIAIADLRREEAAIAAADFVLLHSGWHRYWGEAGYFGAYPVLSPEAAAWLSGFGLKGVGVDTVSLDEVDSTALVVHRTFLAKNIVLVENLANLKTLIGRNFIFSCLPLRIAGGDGSPVRAVAILESIT